MKAIQRLLILQLLIPCIGTIYLSLINPVLRTHRGFFLTQSTDVPIGILIIISSGINSIITGTTIFLISNIVRNSVNERDINVLLEYSSDQSVENNKVNGIYCSQWKSLKNHTFPKAKSDNFQRHLNNPIPTIVVPFHIHHGTTNDF
ncbi:hypothetical protein PMYN1_Chma772 (chromatophore) [Paulinella micropora]|uniref:Uncharacterized protein n=1 Tax=Paulinella micropora TaxID=1928728 RepID=A0A5K7VWK6_9EUKA|nr:hypothetical protein PMYN1_Chma772 [Paulinella micropora]